MRFLQPITLLFVLLIANTLSGCMGLTPSTPRSEPQFVHFGASVQRSGITVTVRSGDTLYDIAQRNQIPLRDLIDINNLRVPFALEVGQILQLPAPQIHTVRRGDTVFGLAQTYGVDQSELVRLNKLTQPFQLTIGQRIRLPAQQYTATSRSVITASGRSTVVDKRLPTIKPQRTAGRVTSQELPPPPSSKPITTAKAPQQVRTTPAKKPRTLSSSQHQPVATGPVRFAWPMQGNILSRFGPKTSGRHNDGINIGAPRGTVVRASEAGEVVYVGDALSGFGQLILLRHRAGWMTAYAHLDKMYVERGAQIERGQSIGTVGSTGAVTSPQLHFEIRKGSQPLNPEKYLP